MDKEEYSSVQIKPSDNHKTDARDVNLMLLAISIQHLMLRVQRYGESTVPRSTLITEISTKASKN